MTKGTTSKGCHNRKAHMLCVRCNKHSFHIQKKRCASCGYPAAKMRKFNWAAKAKRRRTTGSGRMRYMKHVPRRFKNGFREGTTPPSKNCALRRAKDRFRLTSELR